MGIIKFELDKSAKGAMAEREDWWRLCLDTDTGEYWIEHEWDHVNAYNVSETNKGTERHPLEGWSGRGSDKIEAAKAALKEISKGN